MANRFVSPQQQFINFSGQPYAGGFLYFFVSGTSTPTPTYQDEGLSIPNTNPVQLDSAGDAGNIFLDPGIVYKVELTDSSNNPIWTFDPVIPTDSATSSGFSPVVSCNASGTNSITLTPITPSQQPALYSNFQVFAFVPVANTTGAVSLQVGTLPSESVFVAPGVQAGAGTFLAGDGPYFVAYGSLVGGSGPGFLLLNSNIGALQAGLPLPTPQGYLTPTSQTPIIISDAIGATSIFYTPFNGLGALAHNGISIVPIILSGQLSLSLTSAQAASNIYDIYMAYNSGVPVIGTGPSWAAGTGGSVTAGSCARGTGAGGAALVRTQGVWTNAAAMSLIYNLGAGNITLSVSANQGVYLGSISIDTTAGQVSTYVSYGQSRKFGVWNAYNRRPIIMQAGDPNSAWTYNTNTARPSNGNTANSITTFTGLPEEQIEVEFNQTVIGGATNGTTQVISTWLTGIGWNQTNAFNGQTASSGFRIDGSGIDFLSTATSPARYVNPPGLGTNVITSVEQTTGASGSPSVTYHGTISGMLLTTNYRG